MKEFAEETAGAARRVSGFEEMNGMRVTGLALTGILAMCAVLSYRKQGWVRSVTAGVGFFVASSYLDGIFWIIMENGAGDGWGTFLHAVGIFVSKSIMFVLLGALNILEPAGEVKRSWGYGEGLTLGISLFFGILAWWAQGFGRGSGDFGTVVFMTFLLAVLTGYYISCRFYERKLQRKRLQLERDVRKAEAHMYLESVEDHYQRTRELWHDLKNHVNLLNLLLREEKYEQMADYLRILGEDVDGLALPAKSGNLVVDAVLADKAARAKRAGIRMEISLCDLTGLELRPDEICGLLGNLLDNALEACAQVKEERFLRVTCGDRTGCYYIKVENSFAGRPGAAGAALESGKSDRRNRVGHGLGLRSAERIVHGCGGELAIESGEECFAVAVRLPKERE